NVDSGECLWRKPGHAKGESISSVSFSPSGPLLASASDDGTARFWTTAGDPVGQPLVHQNPVRQAAFSPDGRFLLTVDEGKRGAPAAVYVWDAQSARRLRKLPHESGIDRIAINPVSELIATTSG